MIFEGIVNVFVGFVNFVLSLFPQVGPPDWMEEGAVRLDDAFGYAAGLGAWIPWSVVGMVFSAVMACVVLGFTIKLVRIAASFFTAGGGSAA